MAEKIKQSELKKKQIVEAALKLFFEKGYEGTSIRMIQNKVESPVGLFYYYFESKDAVFEEAIKLFFESYEKEMQNVINSSKNKPDEVLTKYINYMDYATQDFRSKYLAKLHWTILSAIREYTLRVMKKYILLILEDYVKNDIVKIPKENITVTAKLISSRTGGNVYIISK
jgi:AcrR family transcriptional regulator